MEELVGKSLLSKDGVVETCSALEKVDYVGLYFSAHWCPPCRVFTPELGSFYEYNKVAPCQTKPATSTANMVVVTELPPASIPTSDSESAAVATETTEGSQPARLVATPMDMEAEVLMVEDGGSTEAAMADGDEAERSASENLSGTASLCVGGEICSKHLLCIRGPKHRGPCRFAPVKREQHKQPRSRHSPTTASLAAELAAMITSRPDVLSPDLLPSCLLPPTGTDVHPLRPSHCADANFASGESEDTKHPEPARDAVPVDMLLGTTLCFVRAALAKLDAAGHGLDKTEEQAAQTGGDVDRGRAGDVSATAAHGVSGVAWNGVEGSNVGNDMDVCGATDAESDQNRELCSVEAASAVPIMIEGERWTGEVEQSVADNEVVMCNEDSEVEDSEYSWIREGRREVGSEGGGDLRRRGLLGEVEAVTACEEDVHLQKEEDTTVTNVNCTSRGDPVFEGS